MAVPSSLFLYARRAVHISFSRWSYKKLFQTDRRLSVGHSTRAPTRMRFYISGDDVTGGDQPNARRERGEPVEDYRVCGYNVKMAWNMKYVYIVDGIKDIVHMLVNES